MKLRSLFVAVWLVLALDAVRPAQVAACSPAPCNQGGFLPRNGATIPANAPAVAWWQPKDLLETSQQPPLLRWTRVDVDPPEPLDFTVDDTSSQPSWVRPTSTLVPGARYRLEVDAECKPEAIEFDVGPAQELPVELGSVKLTGQRVDTLTVGTSSGSCITDISAAIVEAELALGAQARPWAELLVVQPIVDGQLWQPNWDYSFPFSLPAANTTLYAQCSEDSYAVSALAQGAHALTFEADLSGSDRRLQTKSASFELDCDRETSGCSAGGAGRDSSVLTWTCAGLTLLLIRWLLRRIRMLT